MHCPLASRWAGSKQQFEAALQYRDRSRSRSESLLLRWRSDSCLERESRSLSLLITSAGLVSQHNEQTGKLHEAACTTSYL